MKTTLLLLAALAFLATCGGSPSTTATNDSGARQMPAASPTPLPTVITPKDGDYPAKGVVTKINLEPGSVELDHEDIPGVMPPMRMEFFVTDKKMLDGLSVGDKVDFVLRYKKPTETIVSITKTK